MDNDILDSLNDLGYTGPLSEEAALAKALDGGPKSLEYTKLVHILAEELKKLCNLEETVNMMNDPDESSSFLLELSSFLKELGCPYKKLVTGHMSSRLETKEDRVLLLDYMISELMAARIVSVDRPKEKQPGMEIVMQESPTAKDLKDILIALKFNKPPPNITPEMLFSKLENKLKETIQKEGEQLVGKPLYNKAMTAKDWAELETVFSEMYEEYRLRRETLITRLECTVQSFEWSDRLKTKKDVIQSAYRPLREQLKLKPDVRLSDFLAARTSLLHVEKTSSASVRKNTQSDVNKVIIGQVRAWREDNSTPILTPEHKNKQTEKSNKQAAASTEAPYQLNQAAFQAPLVTDIAIPGPPVQTWQMPKKHLITSGYRKKTQRTLRRKVRRKNPLERQDSAESLVIESDDIPAAKLRTVKTSAADESSKKTTDKLVDLRRRRKRKNNSENSSNPTKRVRSDEVPNSIIKESKHLKINRASTNDLYIAVTLDPFTTLTPEQVDKIKTELESRIRSLIGHPEYWPSFRGKPFYSEGVLKLSCESEKDVDWLRNTISTIESPVQNRKLVVINQRDIPRRIKSAIFLPFADESPELIKLMLIGQNRWYQVSKWSFYKVERRDGNTPGTFLILGIPVDDIPIIMARGRRICFGLGSVYVRFFGNQGRLVDTPPENAIDATVAVNSSIEKQGAVTDDTAKIASMPAKSIL